MVFCIFSSKGNGGVIYTGSIGVNWLNVEEIMYVYGRYFF